MNEELLYFRFDSTKVGGKYVFHYAVPAGQSSWLQLDPHSEQITKDEYQLAVDMFELGLID